MAEKLSLTTVEMLCRPIKSTPDIVARIFDCAKVREEGAGNIFGDFFFASVVETVLRSAFKVFKSDSLFKRLFNKFFSLGLVHEAELIAKTAVTQSEKIAMWGALNGKYRRVKRIRDEFARVSASYGMVSSAEFPQEKAIKRSQSGIADFIAKCQGDARANTFRNASTAFINDTPAARKKYLNDAMFTVKDWYPFLKASFADRLDLRSFISSSTVVSREYFITMLKNRMLTSGVDELARSAEIIGKMIDFNSSEIEETRLAAFIRHDPASRSRYFNMLSMLDGSTRLLHVKFADACGEDMTQFFKAAGIEVCTKYYSSEILSSCDKKRSRELFWKLINGLFESPRDFQECKSIFLSKALKGDYSFISSIKREFSKKISYQECISRKISTTDELTAIEDQWALVDLFFEYAAGCSLEAEEAGPLFSKFVIARIVNSEMRKLFYAFGRYHELYGRAKPKNLPADAFLLTEAFVLNLKYDESSWNAFYVYIRDNYNSDSRIVRALKMLGSTGETLDLAMKTAYNLGCFGAMYRNLPRAGQVWKFISELLAGSKGLFDKWVKLIKTSGDRHEKILIAAGLWSALCEVPDKRSLIEFKDSRPAWVPEEIADFKLNFHGMMSLRTGNFSDKTLADIIKLLFPEFSDAVDKKNDTLAKKLIARLAPCPIEKMLLEYFFFGSRSAKLYGEHYEMAPDMGHKLREAREYKEFASLFEYSGHPCFGDNQWSCCLADGLIEAYERGECEASSLEPLLEFKNIPVLTRLRILLELRRPNPEIAAIISKKPELCGELAPYIIAYASECDDDRLTDALFEHSPFIYMRLYAVHPTMQAEFQKMERLTENCRRFIEAHSKAFKISAKILVSKDVLKFYEDERNSVVLKRWFETLCIKLATSDQFRRECLRTYTDFAPLNGYGDKKSPARAFLNIDHEKKTARICFICRNEGHTLSKSDYNQILHNTNIREREALLDKCIVELDVKKMIL